MTTTARAGATAPAAGPRPGTWANDALCAQVDPDLWHPTVGRPVHTAKRICAACPVRTACLDHALNDPSLTGIWGGLTRRERGQLRQETAA
ncbi:WhiB family transcriptional regulator [Streptomyces sp. NPDC003032]